MSLAAADSAAGYAAFVLVAADVAAEGGFAVLHAGYQASQTVYPPAIKTSLLPLHHRHHSAMVMPFQMLNVV